MEPIVKLVHKLLLKKQKTISVAESCTGGELSSLFTQAPGSSKLFLLGIVAYSNKAKINILKIPSKIISSKGAVSKEACSRMSKSIRKLGKSDYGIGITGIAGPTGAQPAKPVGTVFISIDKINKNICKRFVFKGNRDSIRKQTCLKSLELLKKSLF